MRRTRHVVLPVRSWQYTGLLIVSLACLTLGLVSRDREGQAGSLAGPDLQHGAPHKVDACPNEIVFNRLLFYDDLEPDFGPILTDQTTKHTASSENVHPVKKLEARENGRVRVTPSFSAATLQRSSERVSRFSDGQKNVRFVRDHRGSVNRNSQAIEDQRRGNRLAEGNRYDEYHRSRSARSMNRDYRMRNLDVENQRRFTRISDQRSRTHRTISERSSLERQKNRQQREVRNREARETVAEFVVENRAQRSKTRQMRNDQSDRRDSKTRNARMPVDLSATRRTISTASDTDSSTEFSLSTNERRIQRFTRSVRVHQSRVRNSAVASSREDFRSSERKSTKESKSERRNRQIGSIRSLPSVAGLRNARLNLQIRGSRSIVGDSTSRDSRLAVNVRDERLTRRASPFSRSALMTDKSRLIDRRTRVSLNRPIENSRSSERDARQEESQLTSQRRGDRRSRDIRDERSLQRSIRYSRVLRERENFDRRTDRRSSSRSASRRQRSIDNHSLERRDSISDRGIDQQRAMRDSRNRERRNTRDVRGTRSFEFDARSRNSRSLAIRSPERVERDVRAIQRASRVRDVQPALHYRDARHSDRELSESDKYFMDAAVIRRLDNSLPRYRLSRANHRIMKERGSTRIMDGAALTRRDKLMKNNETTRRDFERNRQIREAKTLKNPHAAKFTWADVTNSLTEKIALFTKYDILEQLGIQLLCVVYCASLYSGKGGFSSIFFNRGNRFVIW